MYLCHCVGSQRANSSPKGPTAGVESQDRPRGQLREEGKAGVCGSPAETPCLGDPDNGGGGEYAQAKD